MVAPAAVKAPTAPSTPAPAPVAKPSLAAPAVTKAPVIPVATPVIAPAAVPAAAPISVPAAPKPAVVTKPAPAPTPVVTPKPRATPEVVAVEFSFFDPVATRVTLAGDFNHWSPETVALKRQGDGLWQATVSLKPGKHQYKFIVDGAWVHDPKAKESRANEFGTLNSVIEVRL